ncbi:MAG: DegV family protein [Dehalococcoidales bacterium]
MTEVTKVAVMTDSIACLSEQLAAERGIKVVPAANIMFAGKSYIEGETITADEAYRFLQQDPDSFKTSPMTPGYLVEAYRALSASSKEILFITVASALSAVAKTAETAAEMVRTEAPETTIRVHDSRACASTEGLVVLAAAAAAADGKSLDEVVAVADRARQESHGLMLLDTLRYVYRTGRMSKTASRIAAILNIKPINRLTPEGTIELADRARKRDDGMRRLLRLIGGEAGTKDLHFMLAHAAAAEMAEKFAAMLREEYNCLSLIVADFSPVMGYGSGPGSLFVGFHPELDLSG